jgi:aminoglycoside 2'-N-acetyltransferase I
MVTTDFRLRRLGSTDLSPADVAAIRAILDAAFDDGDPDERFTEDDWQHALGGVHVVLDVAGEILAHAAVVERELHVAGRALRAGYVEAVATAPARQGHGLGTAVMREVGAIIVAGYELGALGTGRHGFYDRLGWRTWRGPTSVRMAQGDQATPEDDGYLLVLRTPTTPPDLDETDPISCEWRPGDVW